MEPAPDVRGAHPDRAVDGLAAARGAKAARIAYERTALRGLSRGRARQGDAAAAGAPRVGRRQHPPPEIVRIQIQGLAVLHGQCERSQGQLRARGHQVQEAGPDARVQLRRHEAVRTQHAVEGEHAAVAHGLAQTETDAASERAHGLPIRRWRIPVGAGARVHELARAGPAQGHHLDRTEHGHAAGQHQAVHAARNAFDEGHHAHARAVPGQEGGGRALRVGRVHAAHEAGAAVDARQRVARPDRAGAPVQARVRRVQGVALGAHDGERAAPHADRVEERVQARLVLERQPGGGPVRVAPAARDALHRTEHDVAAGSRAPFGIPGVDALLHVARQRVERGLVAPGGLDRAARGRLERVPVELVLGRRPGGREPEQERALRAEPDQLPGESDQAGDRAPDQDEAPPAKHGLEAGTVIGVVGSATHGWSSPDHSRGWRRAKQTPPACGGRGPRGTIGPGG